MSFPLHDRMWVDGKRWFGGLGTEWKRWSTPYFLFDFGFGWMAEFKAGPFYLTLGRWPK